MVSGVNRSAPAIARVAQYLSHKYDSTLCLLLQQKIKERRTVWMPAQWTGDMVGKMHNNRITMTQVAEKLGVTKAYVCMVLNGHRNPKGAEQRFMAALDELIKEKEVGNE
jgi:hypothetical protein